MPPNFNALRNNITKKVSSMKDLVPDIAGQIETDFKKFTNEIDNFTSGSIGNILSDLGLNDGSAIGKVTDRIFNATANSRAYSNNFDSKPGSIGTKIKPGQMVPGQSPGPWPNELEGFASMNSIITLSALSKEEVSDPDGTYRSTGVRPESIICRSGGAGTKKVRTAYEKVLGKTVEFFIDNLEMNSIVSPVAGNANVNNISFTITEPYSMGLFYQSLKTAAIDGGWANYLQCNFMLTIEFVGTDEDGNMGVAPYSRRFIPIIINESVFNVTGAGSEYSCKALISNERGFQDDVQSMKTDVNITGRTVREILQSGGQSLTTLLNTRQQDKEEKNQVNVGDQYVIIFPEDKTSASGKPPPATQKKTPMATSQYGGDYGEFDTSGSISKRELTEIYRSITGDADGEVPLNYDEYVNSITGRVKASSDLGKAFKEYANSDFATNVIGMSPVINNTVETGQSPMGQPKFSQEMKDTYPIFARGSAELQTSGSNRMFKFSSGTKITQIIEEVLIISTYGQSLAQQLQDIKDPTGMVTWYKVEADVYPVGDNSEVARTGTSANIYVYRVVPYQVHSSIFANPATPSVGIDKLKQEVAKEYNYIYTGKNKDIIDLEILYEFQYNRAFSADVGSSSAIQRKGASSQAVAGNPDMALKTGDGMAFSDDSAYVPPEGMPNQIESINAIANARGGSEISNSDIAITRMFNDNLNAATPDMVNVNLNILGDPFYLSDNGAGNYHAGDTSFSGMTSDGTANYNNGQIYINVLFRTPIDINTDYGEYTFPEDLLLVESFSGIYKVNEVNHKFEQNKFTQDLVLLRMPNQQNTNSTAATSALVKAEQIEALNEVALKAQTLANKAIQEIDFPSNIIAYQDELAELLPTIQELGTIAEQAKASLNSDALATFGRVGDLAKQLEASMGDFDLAKVGSNFQGIVTNLEGYTGVKLDQIMTSTLPAAPDLSAFGGIGPSVGSISAAARQSAAIGSAEINSLNNNLKNKIGGATSYIGNVDGYNSVNTIGGMTEAEANRIKNKLTLPEVNLPKVDLGGSRMIKNDLTGRWEQFN